MTIEVRSYGQRRNYIPGKGDVNYTVIQGLIKEGHAIRFLDAVEGDITKKKMVSFILTMKKKALQLKTEDELLAEARNHA